MKRETSRKKLILFDQNLLFRGNERGSTSSPTIIVPIERVESVAPSHKHDKHRITIAGLKSEIRRSMHAENHVIRVFKRDTPCSR